MKSEERHELQKNDLSIWIMNLVDLIQRSWLTICAVVILVLGCYVGLNMWRMNSAQKVADAWMEYEGSRDPAHFENVINKYPGTAVIPFAKLRLADTKFAEAQRELMGQRDNVVPALERAHSLYKEVASDASAPEFVRIQASFGVASALEAKGSIDEAQTELSKITDKYAKSDRYKTIAQIAEARVKALQSDDAKSFYQQYTNYKPTAPSFELPPKTELDALKDGSSDKKSLAPLDSKGADKKSGEGKESKPEYKPLENKTPDPKKPADAKDKPVDKNAPPAPPKMDAKPKG